MSCRLKLPLLTSFRYFARLSLLTFIHGRVVPVLCDSEAVCVDILLISHSVGRMYPNTVLVFLQLNDLEIKNRTCS